MGGAVLPRRGFAAAPPQGPGDRYDPWVEVLPEALAHNVAQVGRLGGSPILAVVKNHGYGLDYRIVARLLEPNPDVAGFALVRAGERRLVGGQEDQLIGIARELAARAQ